MRKLNVATQNIGIKRDQLLMAYREVVTSVREARTMQGVLEKERQMRRLMHHLRQTQQA
jgi:hypothetical protein